MMTDDKKPKLYPGFAEVVGSNSEIILYFVHIVVKQVSNIAVVEDLGSQCEKIQICVWVGSQERMLWVKLENIAST